jgi:hypothetical protein
MESHSTSVFHLPRTETGNSQVCLGGACFLASLAASNHEVETRESGAGLLSEESIEETGAESFKLSQFGLDGAGFNGK